MYGRNVLILLHMKSLSLTQLNMYLKENRKNNQFTNYV